ncbi:MAG: efflux RND transporter permease subunit [Beijerinckiaceae bacterium]
MNLNISAWSIRRPLPAIVFAIVTVFLGAVAFTKLPVTRLPNVDVPVVSVAISQFGAAPAELEAQVTKSIEDAVSGVEGVRHITSFITDGLSVTTIAFRLETNTDRALNDVKDAVTRVRSSLPRTIDEPLVQRVDVVGLGIVTYAAISPGKTPEQLSYFVDEVVKRRLQGIRGIGRVERIGGVEREILVSLDPDRVQAVGLTAADVGRRLRGTNIDLAGGRAEIGGGDEAIRTLAGAKTLDGLAGTVITLPAGGTVRLDDLGVVTDTVAEPRAFARVDGEPVVAFSVLRSKGASDVTVANAVASTLGEIHQAYPEVSLKLIDSSVTYTTGNYHSAMETFFEGALLAVFVVAIFLKDWRATLIAAIALPLSILPAFWVMNMFGFSLNLVSLLAITLATGILVDDAIVEIENIARHIRMGKSAYQASLEAADEIGLAVVAISLTIIAIFLPASFMESIAGQFFKQFGLTVSVEVFFSLLCARLVTPMLAAYFLKDQAHAERPPGRVTQSYTRLVAWSVEHRYITVALGVLLFAGSIASTKLLPSGFLPPQDTARSLLAIELPPGTQLSGTQTVTEAITKRLKARPEVQSVFVDGGRIPPATAEIRKAALVINYTPKSERSVSVHDLELKIARELADMPDMRYWFLDDNGQRPVSLIVTGPDSVSVDNFAVELAGQMRGVRTIANVVSSATLDRPELLIRPRRDIAGRLGISTESLSETIRVATIGDVGPALAKFDAGGRLVPIRVQLDSRARGDRQVLERLKVPTASGAGVPLAAIADIELGEGPISINRYDRERQATIQADLVGSSALSDVFAAIDALPLMKNKPPAITVKQAGDAETMQELFDGFATAMRDGLLMVVTVLILLFGSFLQPITILLTLPLSLGGAILGLLLTDKPISMPVVIGFMMLMGIVTKNSIMLVDFIIEARRAGVERTAAIVDAGRKRARPIVMTTIAMVAGMAPSAFAFGAGGEFRSPMAIAVIGGLIVSTVLSLLFVPAFFALVDDIEGGIGGLFFRFVSRGAGRALAPARRADAESDDRAAARTKTPQPAPGE